jgi:hypothetical protein
MSSPDSALQALRTINQEFEAFRRDKGKVSEADTRAKLIDRILTEVCLWPEGGITREDRVDRGYIDYALSVQNRPYIAVEAKREGIAFVFPESTHRTLTLSGSLLTEAAIRDAILQVRGYCDDAGIRYGIATNGYAWIVFRAIREDRPWRDGSARIFASLENIESHFTDFWNLLSYEAIGNGALDEEFGSRIRTPRRLARVVDRLFNADLPLQRNRLHSQLYPLMQTVFENIADQDPVEILQSCYVHTGSLKIVAQDLNATITDAIPRFLEEQGAEPVFQSGTSAGSFGVAISDALGGASGSLYLLLGGIGAGKTTFIKRYQRTVGKDVLDGHALWFHLDFLEAPLDPHDMELFVWRGVLDQLRQRYASPNLETRKIIRRIFSDSIEAIRQTAFRPGLYGEQFDAAISPYLEKWQADTSDYVPRLLRFAKSDRRLHVVVFIDNVDQLSPICQAQVFALAQRTARLVGAITVLALREESFYTATTQRTLTAYTSRKFHIASPRFRSMIDNRIRFALKILEQSEGPVDYVLPRQGVEVDRHSIAELLRIVETSIFEQNQNIARFIEYLCFGNMRLALNMFSTFMTSGATDVDKMLHIYRRSGAYYVAFHEFVKSIMLGERRYYKDAASPIMNVFDCGAGRNASHFTALRVIRLLAERRGESTREGQGYVDIGELVGMSEDIFDNREDIVRTLNRLVLRQLIEANTKSTDTIAGASHVRVTQAGWYYDRYLVRSFSYIDLALQDTPINDPQTEAELRDWVQQVDNLGDRDDQKLTRMDIRFARVRAFVDYLKREEAEEEDAFDLSRAGGAWSLPLMTGIAGQIDREIEWIERRLKQNRELFPDDVRLWEDDPGLLDTSTEDETAE